MPISRTLKKTLGLSVAVILLMAAGVYLLACLVPSDYAPAQLNAAQKNQAVKDFWEKIQDFGNDAQDIYPYQWSVTQEQLNQYLASVDEIVASTPSGVPGKVNQEMDQVGLASPAVSLKGGVLRLMIRSREYNKILSVGLRFDLDDEGQLRVRLVHAKLGRLTMPNSLLRNQLDQLEPLLSEASLGENISGRRGLYGISPQDLARMLETLLAAVNEEPIPAEIVWPINRKRVRIKEISIDQGTLRLKLEPILSGDAEN